MNLYILQNFNNYTERKIKGYQNITNYLYYVIGQCNNVNFNPNDGIYTDYVACNLDLESLGYPDYLLVCDDSNNIISRWFILNTTRLRESKWRLDLRHDLVYDNVYNVVNNENTLIKKGYANLTSISLFNREDFNFNEIKTSESYLKYYNNTNFDCFLVAYLPKTFGSNDDSIELSSNFSKLELRLPKSGWVITEQTNDAPFDIYAIPFKSSWVYRLDNEFIKYKIVDSRGVEIANAKSNGSQGLLSRDLFNFFSYLGSYAYDLQIIPFTSIDNNNVYMDEDTLVIKETYNTQGIIYDKVKVPTILWLAEEGTPEEYEMLEIPMALVRSSTFNYTISSPAIQDNTTYNPVDIKKLQNEKFRLISPDYSSAIELNRDFNSEFDQDNEGNIYIRYGFPDFYIHCKLQPIQPYIYIEPKFKFILNGNNFTDTRGMLCNYNFSIAQTSDKWAEFLLNNKNYLNTFNQEVKNLEIKKTQSIIGGTSNIVGTTAGGAASGAIMGSVIPGVGTAVGAVVGGVAGLLTGAYNMGENIYNTNRAIGNYKRSFKWSCENIKAMPNTLNKVSTIVNSNKIFPIIERYVSHAQEKDNFDKYLRLNGMTIDMVGPIKNYWNNTYNYIEAAMIRFPQCSCTANQLNEINKELDSGLFFESIE